MGRIMAMCKIGCQKVIKKRKQNRRIFEGIDPYSDITAERIYGDPPPIRFKTKLPKRGKNGKTKAK